MQVGTTKDQGLYNKPSAAVHPGALAAGTLPQYNTWSSKLKLQFLYKERFFEQKHGNMNYERGNNLIFEG